jgi:hypothetical protein
MRVTGQKTKQVYTASSFYRLNLRDLTDSIDSPVLTFYPHPRSALGERGVIAKIGTVRGEQIASLACWIEEVRDGKTQLLAFYRLGRPDNAQSVRAWVSYNDVHVTFEQYDYKTLHNHRWHAIIKGFIGPLQLEDEARNQDVKPEEIEEVSFSYNGGGPPLPWTAPSPPVIIRRIGEKNSYNNIVLYGLAEWILQKGFFDMADEYGVFGADAPSSQVSVVRAGKRKVVVFRQTSDKRVWEMEMMIRGAIAKIQHQAQHQETQRKARQQTDAARN